MKKCLLFLLFIFFLTFKIYALENDKETNTKIVYKSHIQSIGWQEEKNDGELSGTTGLSKRIEALKIKLSSDIDGNVEYKSYVESIGWEDNYKINGEESGTTGKARRIEALRIKLTGNVSEEYDIYYRVHVQSLGWLGWAKNDEIAGTIGYNYRIEAIEIKLLEKGIEFDLNGSSFFKRSLSYQSHIQSIGWQNKKYDGETSGIVLGHKRIEALRVFLNDDYYSGGIEYKSYVENSGWENNYKINGEESGTTGKARRIEALRIKLTGNVSEEYDIYYRVHVQSLGWLGWAKDDEIAGTIGYSYMIEAIQIKLMKKGEQIKNEKPSFYKNNLIYQTHIQSIGWQEEKNDGELSGTTGLSKRIEALKIKLSSDIDGNIEYKSYIEGTGWEDNYSKNYELSGTTGKARRIEALRIKLTGNVSEEYDIYYRVHVQSLGWLGWAKNDEAVGTIGYDYRVEGLEVKLLMKNEDFTDEKVPFYKRIIKYQSYIQNIGWQDQKFDGDTSGLLIDESVVNSFKVQIVNKEYDGDIIYKSLISNFGWENNYKKSNEVSGISGSSKFIEALQIKLVGEISNYYDVYYRVLTDNYGWLGWAKNGDYAGTSGYNYSIKGLEIKLVDKSEQIVLSDKETYYETKNGYFILSSKVNDEYAVSVNGNSYINNGNIIYKLRNDVTGQIWKIKDLQNGYYRIESAVNPSLSIGICNTEFINGSNVCLNNEINNWKIKDLGDGYFSIFSDNDDLSLSISNNNLVASSYSGLDNQKFKFISFNDTKIYKGIDISKWQGKIDWNLLALDNPEFIIMRIGTGRNNYEKDSMFEEYYGNARKYNIPVGAYTYSFATNITEAKKEANLTIEWLNNKRLDLPVFYDIENINQTLLGKDVLTLIADTFCQIIMNNGYKCGVYANKYFLNDNLDALELEKKYPIWLAHWTGAYTYQDIFSDFNKYGSDYNLTSYKYWQFSSLGVYKGITENTVDLNFGYDIFD